MLRTYGQTEIKSLSIGKPPDLLAQHPAAFHAFHICYILIFKDIFPGVKFSGHILGVFRKMQPVFLSLIPGKSVIIHRHIGSKRLHVQNRKDAAGIIGIVQRPVKRPLLLHSLNLYRHIKGYLVFSVPVLKAVKLLDIQI